MVVPSIMERSQAHECWQEVVLRLSASSTSASCMHRGELSATGCSSTPQIGMKTRSPNAQTLSESCVGHHRALSSGGRRDVKRAPPDLSLLRHLSRTRQYNGVSRSPLSSSGTGRSAFTSSYVGQEASLSPMLWSWAFPLSGHENPKTPEKALESLEDAVWHWREAAPLRFDIDRDTPPKVAAPTRPLRSFSDSSGVIGGTGSFRRSESAAHGKEVVHTPLVDSVTPQLVHGGNLRPHTDASLHSSHCGTHRKQHIDAQQEAPRVPSLLADVDQNMPAVLWRPASASVSSQQHGPREGPATGSNSKESPVQPSGIPISASTTSPTAVPATLLPLSEFSVNSPHLGPLAASRSREELPSSIRNALHFLRKVPELPASTGRGPMLPALSRTEYPITLVLDLDETLVHCSRGSSCWSSEAPDVIVNFEDHPTQGNVHFRPFAKLFLEIVARSFEVVVFTASQQTYADRVLDMLDPTGKTIHHRLYRPHCTEHRGAYFKELGLLGRPLSRCILVDNSPVSCACNADNSVLCRSWYGDALDRELLDLLALLEDLQQSTNIPMHLAARYGLYDFFQALRQGPRVL